MKILNFISVAVLVATAQAGTPPTARDFYDCYQGFDSFPISTAESGFKNPFFIIPVGSSEAVPGKNSFLILNPKGAQLLVTDKSDEHVIDSAGRGALATNRQDLSISPLGEKTEVKTTYYTHPDHHAGATPVGWIQQGQPGKQAVPMSALDEPNYFRSAVVQKEKENEAELSSKRLEEKFLYSIKQNKALALKGLEISAQKLNACNKFTGDVGLQSAKMAQYRLIAHEKDLIDNLDKKQKTDSGSDTSAPAGIPR